jgi:Domain of unknown function (DUF5655)/Domain of unknown function (DUF4287)
MASVEDGLQAQIRNIEATYGKTMPEWFAVISRSGKTKHTEVVAMLKGEYGMTHGAAHRVSLLARQAADAPHEDTSDPTAALYTAKKAAARPIHEALMKAVATFGDVTIAPKKGYLSLRRRKQFAMIQPSTTGRVDLGLILKDQPAEGRLEPAAGFNALFTHRVRLAAVAEVDDELTSWLRLAYDQAG